MLAAVSVGGGAETSGRFSTLSSVSSCLEGVSSSPDSSNGFSGVKLDNSSGAAWISSGISSATGGIGSSSDSATVSSTSSCAGVSIGAGARSSGTTGA
jgi:hypothetical protein